MTSRQTPRKPPARHARQPSNLIPAVSDYESDAAAAAAAIQAPYDPPPPRTNTELNLAVLQRYLPSIQTILSIAANAVVYTFDADSQSWDKSGIEGTMFVCAQSPLPDSDHSRTCVFVLNRRALQNLILDLAHVSHVEITDELIMLKVESSSQVGDGVVGLWVHNDNDETRKINAAVIQERWKAASLSHEAQRPQASSEAGPALQAIGETTTLDNLMGQQIGTEPVS